MCRIALALALVVLLVAGCSTPTQREPTPPTGASTSPPSVTSNASLALDLVRDGLQQPVLALGVPDGSRRLAIVEQGGRVWLGNDTLLDVSARIASGGEQGLLGFAFIPGYAQHHEVLASFTDLEGNSVLARYHVAENGTYADPASEEIVLHVDQPYPNHNGGNIVYGPDGMLYLGLGDGGSGGDPHGNGQNPRALLGSMLRIDVGPTGPYRVPPSNPFVGRADAAPELWAKGLRNPWRFSFDRATGDLYIGDVGQDVREEIDYQPASSKGGENYGWNVWEGTDRYSPTGVTFAQPTAPVATYTHDEGGCSVTGGYVLRGPHAGALAGTYVYADYCSGKLWGLRHTTAGWNATLLLETGKNVSSFGEDEAGDVYLVDHGGSVYRLAVTE